MWDAIIYYSQSLLRRDIEQCQICLEHCLTRSAAIPARGIAFPGLTCIYALTGAH